MKQIPYDHRRPARAEIFVGRHTLVDEMANGLRAGYCYGLVGQPGIGKTSMLLALQRKLHDWIKPALPLPLPAYVELHDRHLASAGNLCELFLSAFLDILVTRHRLIILPTEEALLRDQARHGHLEEALQRLAELNYQQHTRLCRFVFLLDDLHRGQGYEALSDFLSMLRPLASSDSMAVNISFVFAGEMPLEEEFGKDVSSLRALLSSTPTLTPLLENDVITLVDLARDFGWPVETGCEKMLFTLTDGYPFKLHYYLFTALSEYKACSKAIFQEISQNPQTQRFLNAVLKQHPLAEKPSLPAQTRSVVEIFYSCTSVDEDQKALKLFEKQFAVLRRQKHIQDWHMGKIKGGKNREQERLKHFKRADIILLLISPDYIASDTLYNEAETALRWHREKKAIVIPILLRRVANLDRLDMSGMQALPRSGEWLLDKQEDASQLCAAIVEEVSVMVQKLREA